ncbi:phosphoglycerate kinase [Halocatena pleomorpha]|uniref:Phosphoglycerate kinase n=1 Tax=Halocatena pleomorpha TaxID=1785090 RepID=A0A3P3RGY8_9EURY|nr:phosphoglycerate kinase [Halocatena pleomorpha]RRJ32806.1 phosphoglycerate kinase [Halocatena pleomorpha]
MIRTLDDLDASGTAVGVRVDINSPLTDDGQLADDARLRAHVDTLSELTERNARVAVLAHQGRPAGDEFMPLSAHARRLDELLDAPVEYIDATFCKAARDRIEALENGSVLVLENTRFYSEENMSFDPASAAETHLVDRLSMVLDVFVNDAFAAAHRSQPSIVGFAERLPSFGGRVMERELEALGEIRERPSPRVYVLGGAKVDDSIEIAETVLQSGIADTVLTTGVVGNAFLHASGVSLGAETASVVTSRARDRLDLAADLLERYPERIQTPVDVAVERDGERVEHSIESLPVEQPALDVGQETIDAYTEVFEAAGTVVLNGPAGVFEDERFAVGTTELYSGATDAGFSIVGGGDTAAALRQLGLSGFDHVSTGGGAALALLTGEQLPAVTALDSKT